MSYFENIYTGRLGESIIAKWCKARGNSVLPIYETPIENSKGPRFFTPQGELVAPDLFIIPAMQWIEAKHKTVFSWHFKTSRWCTGIDLNHYLDYQKVQKVSGRQVWLMFLHNTETPDKNELAKGCPPRCPTGLFGGSLDYLVPRENHRSDKWGKHGMVYWSHDVLKQFSTLENLNDVRSKADGNPLTMDKERERRTFAYREFQKGN